MADLWFSFEMCINGRAVCHGECDSQEPEPFFYDL